MTEYAILPMWIHTRFWWKYCFHPRLLACRLIQIVRFLLGCRIEYMLLCLRKKSFAPCRMCNVWRRRCGICTQSVRVVGGGEGCQMVWEQLVSAGCGGQSVFNSQAFGSVVNTLAYVFHGPQHHVETNFIKHSTVCLWQPWTNAWSFTCKFRFRCHKYFNNFVILYGSFGWQNRF